MTAFGWAILAGTAFILLFVAGWLFLPLLSRPWRRRGW